MVTRQDFGPTGFTAAIWAMELHRWYTPAGLVTAVRDLTSGGAPFVYAYYEGIDKVAHAEGLAWYYDDDSGPWTVSSATCSRYSLPERCSSSPRTTARWRWADRSS